MRIPQDPGAAGRFAAHHFVSILQGYSVATEREEGTKNSGPIRSPPSASTVLSSWSKPHGTGLSLRNSALSPMAPMTTKSTLPLPRSVPFAPRDVACGSGLAFTGA